MSLTVPEYTLLSVCVSDGPKPTQDNAGRRHIGRLYLADRGADRRHDAPSKQRNDRLGRPQSTEANADGFRTVAIQQVVDADHVQVRRFTL